MAVGDASYCLLKEDISPLIRSSGACIRKELARICGSIACALSGRCTLDFTVVSDDSDVSRSEYKSSEVVCQTCRQGNVISFM